MPGLFMPGLFITFEGSEGCGKSTQVRRLQARLEADGASVLPTREPGGTPVGETIRDLLQHQQAGVGMSSEAELLLFAASRAELVRKVIEPALEAGTHVISDRFYDSTAVYQGEARGLGREAVEGVTRLATGGRRPDITFLLDLPVETVFARLKLRSGDRGKFDRFEALPTSFFEHVRQAYLKLAAREPDRIRLLNGLESEENLASPIWDQLKPILHGS